MGSSRIPAGLNADLEQVTSALEKIGDPWLRYAISMSVEMIAERIAELERTATVRIRHQTRSTQPEALAQASV
jgi:hypothetical protein